MDTVPIEHFSLDNYLSPSKTWTQLIVWEGMNGPITVPVAIVKGKEPGPIVVAVAGVHGDEFEGMEAIRALVAELDPQQLPGTFIGVPVINPFSYEGQMRETPALWDGLNLARQFPGKAIGSVTTRLASLWSTWLTTLLGPEDVFIDFHSAGTRYEYVSMVAFHATNDQTEQRSRALASVFGMKRLWRIPDREDTRVTFNGSIARCGIPTLATEVRGRGSCMPEDVAELQEGLHRILTWKNMLAAVEKPTAIPEDTAGQHEGIWSTDWVLVRTSGFFRSRVELLEKVKTGQLLGEIITPAGTVLEEVHAPLSGDIWGIRRFSTVQSGDYVFLIAFAL